MQGRQRGTREKGIPRNNQGTGKEITLEKRMQGRYRLSKRKRTTIGHKALCRKACKNVARN